MTTSNKPITIIGLAGTNGSGKDTVGHILADHHGFLFISVTELLRAELRRRGLPVIRENTRMISAEWRRELGLGVLVDKAVAEYETQKDTYNGVVMASLRNPGEADRLHEFGGKLIWIDADPRIRYDRIQANAGTRGRPEEDNKTFEQFMQEEADEMHAPVGSDSAALDGAAVKTRADIFIDNGHGDIDRLRTEVEKALGLA